MVLVMSSRALMAMKVIQAILCWSTKLKATRPCRLQAKVPVPLWLEPCKALNLTMTHQRRIWMSSLQNCAHIAPPVSTKRESKSPHGRMKSLAPVLPSSRARCGRTIMSSCGHSSSCFPWSLSLARHQLPSQNKPLASCLPSPFSLLSW